MARFQDRVAVVTGSGTGIGQAIALALSAEGANVVVNSRREISTDDTPTAKDTAAQIESAGGRAIAVFSDVGTFEGANRVIAAALDAYGRVDILVNNAGAGSPTKPAVEFT